MKDWTKLVKGTKVRCKRTGRTGTFLYFVGYIAQCSGKAEWCSAGCDLEVVG